MSALISPDEARLFFKLHRSLMFHINQQLEIVPNVSSPEAFAHLSPAIRFEVRDAFVEHPDLIDQFVRENPLALSDEELQIVHSWRDFVFGRFFIFRHLKKHTVFLSERADIAYGVLALSEPFEDVVGPSLPVLVGAMLLPFRDKIVYDGLLGAYSISIGGGVKRGLDEQYRKAKERMGGVVTTLPAKPKATTGSKPRKKSERRATSSASTDVRPVLETIVGLTDEFCQKHLDGEYAALCRKLAEKLAHKRPSPLLRGKPVSWACGIVRTIGWVNFLSDPTQPYSMRLVDIDHRFGVAESTGAAKLQEIRNLLKIHQLDPQWTLPSHLDDNPLVWMLEINGLLMDVRSAPREIQEVAFKKGLIPYIPADRE